MPPLVRVASTVAPVYKFLIVDDEEDSRFLLRHFLRKGFPAAEVTECASLDEAILVVRKTHFDGIITDHHPGTPDVIGVIREARQQHTGCPILMVTASSDPQVHRRAYDAGATQVLADGDFDITGYLRAKL